MVRGRGVRIAARLRDAGLREDVLAVATAAGYLAAEVPNAETLLDQVRNGDVEAVLLETQEPQDLALIRRMRELGPEVAVIGVGSAPPVDLVVEAFRAGAADLLRMPFDVSSLERALAQAARGVADWRPERSFLTRDPETLRLLEQLRRVAATDATVRLVGESGTGKDLLARWIHQASARRAGPLVVVSCAGLAPELAESELFGHVRGAFTGAHEARPGQIAMADGGTLVLDEVGDLAPALQPKLLRALQEREVQPLGGRSPRPVDIRVVVTTQRDLAAEVAAHRFRADLYYRLDVVSVRIPPLRERSCDLPLLARTFLERFAGAMGREPAQLGEDALARLAAHPFRGNVRELQNLMRRASILFGGREVEVDRLLGSEASPPEVAGRELRSLNLRELERAAVARSLEVAHGNRTVASRALGISVRTLRNKIRLYGLA